MFAQVGYVAIKVLNGGSWRVSITAGDNGPVFTVSVAAFSAAAAVPASACCCLTCCVSKGPNHMVFGAILLLDAGKGSLLRI
jgi:hypothetical protein